MHINGSQKADQLTTIVTPGLRAQRLAALKAAGKRAQLTAGRDAFWCPADELDQYDPSTKPADRAYKLYLEGGPDPRD